MLRPFYLIEDVNIVMCVCMCTCNCACTQTLSCLLFVCSCSESLTTYKELCSVASDMNQPDLVYKFLSLSTHHSVWNSKKVMIEPPLVYTI